MRHLLTYNTERIQFFEIWLLIVDLGILANLRKVLDIKGVVHFKKKKKTFADNLLISKFTLHVHVFLSSVEKKLRFLMKTF